MKTPAELLQEYNTSSEGWLDGDYKGQRERFLKGIVAWAESRLPEEEGDKIMIEHLYIDEDIERVLTSAEVRLENKLNEVIEEVNRLVEYNNPFATHKERLKLQEELLFVPQDSAKEKETPTDDRLISDVYKKGASEALADFKKRLLAQLKDAVAIQELSFTAPEHTPGLYEAIKIVEETDPKYPYEWSEGE